VVKMAQAVLAGKGSLAPRDARPCLLRSVVPIRTLRRAAPAGNSAKLRQKVCERDL
jgi:hypothetical protein